MIVILFSTFSAASNTSDEELNSADSEVEGEVDSTFRRTHSPKADDAPADQNTFQLLDALDKASIYMRRAMVNNRPNLIYF